MIIYSKLNAIYSKDEIYRRFPTATARKIIFCRDIVKPSVLIKYCSFKEINYSYEDFLEDYPKFLEYKASDILYKIYKAGYSVLQFRAKYDINSYFEYMLKNGLDFNSPIENGYKIIEFMGYRVDVSKFKIDKYDTHIELFGDPEQLKAFKEKYNLKFEVLYEPYKESWHLAFNGMLADYIKIYK